MMNLANYQNLCVNVVEMVSDAHPRQPTLQEISDEVGVHVNVLLTVADDCDELMLNVGFGTAGGHYEIESPSDYTLEYMGEVGS